jgi:hypothetical protein
MKIFDRGGRKEWKFPKPWDCIVSNTAGASTLKKNDS